MPSRAARGCHVQRLGHGVSQPCPGAPAQWFVAWQPSASPRQGVPPSGGPNRDHHAVSGSRASSTPEGRLPPWQRRTNVWRRLTNLARRAKRPTATNADPLTCQMKPTIKIRFTEPQIARVMRAHPNCNLDHLTELSFEFDQAGTIIDCIGKIKDGGNIDHNYAGSGLARLYDRARRQLTDRQTSATILQFPNGERLATA